MCSCSALLQQLNRRSQGSTWISIKQAQPICSLCRVGEQCSIFVQTLVEVAQRFEDGRRRVRNLPLSEKMKPEEDPCAAAERGIHEELSGYVGDDTIITVAIDPEQPEAKRSQSVSKSYPGLLSSVRVLNSLLQLVHALLDWELQFTGQCFSPFVR